MAVTFNKFVKMNENKDDAPRFSPRFNPKTGKEMKPKKLTKEEIEALSRQGDSQEAARMDLLSKFNDLSKKIKGFNPKSMKEIKEMKEDIAKDRDEILNHSKYDELKNEGFPWGDTTMTIDIPLSKLKYELRRFQERLEKSNFKAD